MLGNAGQRLPGQRLSGLVMVLLMMFHFSIAVLAGPLPKPPRASIADATDISDASEWSWLQSYEFRNVVNGLVEAFYFTVDDDKRTVLEDKSIHFTHSLEKKFPRWSQRVALFRETMQNPNQFDKDVLEWVSTCPAMAKMDATIKQDRSDVIVVAMRQALAINLAYLYREAQHHFHKIHQDIDRVLSADNDLAGLNDWMARIDAYRVDDSNAGNGQDAARPGSPGFPGLPGLPRSPDLPPVSPQITPSPPVSPTGIGFLSKSLSWGNSAPSSGPSSPSSPSRPRWLPSSPLSSPMVSVFFQKSLLEPTAQEQASFPKTNIKHLTLAELKTMTKELETKQTLLRRLAVILQNVDDPPNWFGTWVAQFSWSVDELPDYTSVVETSEQKLLYHLQLLDLGSVSHFVQFNKDSKEYIDAAYKYLTLGVANRDALAQIDQLVITYFSKLGNHITKMADFDLKQWIQETDERLKTDVNLLLFDELKNFPTSWTTVYGGSKWGQDGAYHKRQKSLESLELKQFSHQVPDARGHTHPHTHTRSHSDSAIASSSKVPSHSSRVPLELFKGLSHAA